MRKILFLVSILILIFTIPQVVPIKAQEEQTVIGIDLTPGRVEGIDTPNGKALLKALKTDLEKLDFKVVELKKISIETLEGVDALILGKIADKEHGFTDDEIRAIKDWFNYAGRFIYISGDGDYPTDGGGSMAFKAEEPNKILEAIGSRIRIEPTSVMDPLSNGGEPYECIAKEANSENFAWKISWRRPGGIYAGFTNVLFHTPTILAGYKAGEFVPLDEIVDKDLVWVFKTSAEAVIVDHDDVAPRSVKVGDKGAMYGTGFVLVAAERIPVRNGYSRVLVAGESPIGSNSTWTKVFKGRSLVGPEFGEKAFEWGTLKLEVVETGEDYTPHILVAIFLALVAIAIYRRRRKKAIPVEEEEEVEEEDEEYLYM